MWWAWYGEKMFANPTHSRFWARQWLGYTVCICVQKITERIKAWRERQVSISILRNVLSEQYKHLYGNCLAKLLLEVSNIGENWLHIQGYDLRLQQLLYIES